MATKPLDKAIDYWKELGKTIRIALAQEDASQILPQIEEALTVRIQGLSPMELSEITMLCLFVISKVANCKATMPNGDIKAAVVSARAIEKNINEGSAKYDMDVFDIGLHMVTQPTFKPKPEDLLRAAMADDLANLDPVGSC